NGMELITATMESDDPVRLCDDTKLLMGRYFDNYISKTINPRNTGITQISVSGKKVPIKTKTDLELLIPKDSTISDISYNAQSYQKDFPIEEGTAVGKVVATCNGKIVGSCEVYAAKKIPTTKGMVLRISLISVAALAVLTLIIFVVVKITGKARRRRFERDMED
ncbi:MAG: hypothetical protein RR472_09035, partial [Anaerovoracaceae bacterium]